MKKYFLVLLVIVVSFNCYSQISFEKGYYIDNNSQKINCLIKNVDWKNNPTEFKYKLFEGGEIKKATIKLVKEFGIYNISKYVRSVVNIDRTGKNLNYEKAPIFKQEKLFLKVLVEGKANLYQYVDNNLRRYFYNKDNSKIEQLIFKSYKITENTIAQNNRFRQQLWGNLQCPNFKMNKIANMKYRKNNLVRFFTQYNEYYNNEFINFESKQKRDLFDLNIRPRLNSSSLAIENFHFSYGDTNFGNKISLAIGMEAEFIFPFNKNKWAIIIEPTYQNFKSKKTSKLSNGKVLAVNVNYSSIEVPVGGRYYFFLNNTSKIFLNASYIFDLSLKSSIEFNKYFNLLKIKTRNNVALGIGYKYSDKYSLEIRYQTDRRMLENHIAWSSKYKTMSIIFGYSLF